MHSRITGQNLKVIMNVSGERIILDEISSFDIKKNTIRKKNGTLGESSASHQLLGSDFELSLKFEKSSSNLARIAIRNEELQNNGMSTLSATFVLVFTDPEGMGQEVHTYNNCKFDIDTLSVGSREDAVVESMTVFCGKRSYDSFIALKQMG